ncbi:MAG TPA: S9 family peptidase [Gemmatimonadales bacterium]|nr:S9 family peptidase [Gemmatimonadales bacterium]
MTAKPLIALAATVLLASAPLPAQAPKADPSLLSVDRIFASADFRSQSFGPSRWLGDGSAYTTLEAPADSGKGRDLVQYDTRSGARTVLVTAKALVPPGDSVPLAIEGYAWSPDLGTVLIFTNSQPVWRTNTRGDYWAFERATGRLHKLGGPAQPSTLMFAKFSPDGRRVGYVRENNLYVEDLATGALTQLTTDGSRTMINGTFDWVYEEELGLQDGWRWSPDGTAIAYWQLNADEVRDFDLIDNTDSLYSFAKPIQYPKAGQANSAARIGVVPAAGGSTRWLDIPGDPRNNYLARMDWADNSTELWVQQLNRLQNTNTLLIGNARSGAVQTIFVDRDSAWVETVDDFTWLDGGKRFLWTSERDGWMHAYSVSRDGSDVRLITPGAFDVLGVTAVDVKGGWLYYIASPDNPAQRYLYRTRLDGTGRAMRLTPATQAGVHSYNASPNAAYALHSHSSFGVPSSTDLVALPSHQSLRVLAANTTLKERVAALRLGPTEFFKVDIGGGVVLNGWIMKPPGFDSTRSYPVLFYVYGGPGSQTVMDSWGGSTWLWHAMLTQQGYLVASVDNRGTGARGRDFRKVIYGQMGVIETQDQAAAARAIGRWGYVDSTRIGIWGWSYGGFMTLNTLFQANDVYSMGVAVAPVTHWKYYDNIYTERYNGLPQENAAGYDRGSPLSYADKLTGRLLVVHGTGDDNVHYQNTEALQNALVKANKQYTMMSYPNRNHGIFGGNTTRHLRTLLTDYIHQNLPASPPAATP